MRYLTQGPGGGEKIGEMAGGGINTGQSEKRGILKWVGLVTLYLTVKCVPFRFYGYSVVRKSLIRRWGRGVGGFMNYLEDFQEGGVHR